jgi:hypothetical protein
VDPLSTPLTHMSCQMAWPTAWVARAERRKDFIVTVVWSWSSFEIGVDSRCERCQLYQYHRSLTSDVNMKSARHAYVCSECYWSQYTTCTIDQPHVDHASLGRNPSLNHVRMQIKVSNQK